MKLANDPAERFGTSNARFIEFIRCVKTCFLNNVFRSNVVVDPKVAKSALIRSIAARCIDGEFDESAWLAASDPECIALGVTLYVLKPRCHA